MSLFQGKLSNPVDKVRLSKGKSPFMGLLLGTAAAVISLRQFLQYFILHDTL